MIQRQMNIQDARIKAEQVTRDICIDLEEELKIDVRSIIQGISYINDVEEKLVKAIMHFEDTLDLEKEINNYITDCAYEYM